MFNFLRARYCHDHHLYIVFVVVPGSRQDDIGLNCVVLENILKLIFRIHLFIWKAEPQKEGETDRQQSYIH